MIYAHVYGKGHGCSKCTVLKQRLEGLLQKPEYNGIQMKFSDVLTADGLVDFLKAEVLNPNRIPALIMETQEGPLYMDRDDTELFQSSCTGHYLGIQTDYTHGGVIPPATIKGLLDKALELNG